jgi:tetratricopeptide (TPR) repeat protein
LREALRLDPDLNAAYSDLWLVLTRLNDLDGALEAGRAAVQREPANARAHTNLAVACDAFGELGASLGHYRAAAELEPENPVMQKNLGTAYLEMDDRAAAERCYREATRLRPDYAEACASLAQLRKYISPDDADAVCIRDLLASQKVPEEERAQLHFALGKIYDDCGLYELAFEQFSLGNGLENRKYSFKPADLRERVSRLTEFFRSGFFDENAGIGSESESPVFVVGMPRSGTTLVEQIIATHPRAFGAGELLWLNEAEKGACSYFKSAQSYPDCLASAPAKKLAALASQYLGYTGRLSSGAERVVDKLPANFLRIGLIRLLFPNAKVIHCRRNPQDTAVSIYANLFSGSIHWGYDLFNIGAYYAEYQRLMAHWHAVLPGWILDVQYENLVREPEVQSRRLVDFAGLPWDPACVKFHDNRRRVRPASCQQVRQPMYTGSLGRGARYKAFLEPFEKALRLYAEDSFDGLSSSK